MYCKLCHLSEITYLPHQYLRFHAQNTLKVGIPSPPPPPPKLCERWWIDYSVPFATLSHTVVIFSGERAPHCCSRFTMSSMLPVSLSFYTTLRQFISQITSPSPLQKNTYEKAIENYLKRINCYRRFRERICLT